MMRRYSGRSVRHSKWSYGWLRTLRPKLGADTLVFAFRWIWVSHWSPHLGLATATNLLLTKGLTGFALPTVDLAISEKHVSSSSNPLHRFLKIPLSPNPLTKETRRQPLRRHNQRLQSEIEMPWKMSPATVPLILGWLSHRNGKTTYCIRKAIAAP